VEYTRDTELVRVGKKGDLGKNNCYIVVARGRNNWTRATRKWCVSDTERDSDLVYIICNRTDIY
jgi:hypothetical protein